MTMVRVLLHQESLEAERLNEQVVIVLDILFATSTIVHAFAEGVRWVYPAMDSDEANLIAAEDPDCVRAGEFLAETLPGFASPTPLALGRELQRDGKLVYCTTNGTVALRRASKAEFVYVGSLLNGAALVAHVVCAGSVGHFNLEDFYGAGHIVSHFLKYPGYELNDAASAAHLLRAGCTAATALLSSRVGRMMCARSLQHEVEYVSHCDRLDVVARLDKGRLKRVAM
jgi:2-phosphosulfolactate phosphatase